MIGLVDHWLQGFCNCKFLNSLIPQYLNLLRVLDLFFVCLFLSS